MFISIKVKNREGTKSEVKQYIQVVLEKRPHCLCLYKLDHREKVNACMKLDIQEHIRIQVTRKRTRMITEPQFTVKKKADKIQRGIGKGHLKKFLYSLAEQDYQTVSVC